MTSVELAPWGDPAKLNCSRWLEKNKLARNFTVASLSGPGRMVVLGRTGFRKSGCQGWVHFHLRGIVGSKTGVAPESLTSQSRWAAAEDFIEKFSQETVSSSPDL